MTDPLQNLLQATDRASTPAPPADLVTKVHRRQRTRATKSRRLKIGVAATCVAIVFAVIRTQPPAPEGHGRTPSPIAQNTTPSPSQVAIAESLLRETADLKAEA